MYDAIIVGARCAGAATAMLLARQGYKILLVDKATFPSDTLSSHILHISGGALLKKWGLLDQIPAAGFLPTTRIAFDMGPVVLRSSFPPLDGVDAVYCPRRRVLDTILVKAAEKAGAEVHTGYTVEELVWDGERVVGIKGRAGHGATGVEEARVVVGADGMRSLVAKAVQAPAYNERPPLTAPNKTH